MERSDASATQVADRRASFDRFVEARLDASYRLATMLLHDPVEAEDATHDALIKAWDRWADLRDPDRFNAWFARILVNGCRDRLRSRRLEPLRDSIVDTLTDPAAPPDTVGEREALTHALAGLNPDQRIAVILRFGLDLPLGQIAQLTGARLGTVKSRLHQGLRVLSAAYASDERQTDSEVER